MGCALCCDCFVFLALVPQTCKNQCKRSYIGIVSFISYAFGFGTCVRSIGRHHYLSVTMITRLINLSCRKVNFFFIVEIFFFFFTAMLIFSFCCFNTSLMFLVRLQQPAPQPMGRPMVVEIAPDKLAHITPTMVNIVTCNTQPKIVSQNHTQGKLILEVFSQVIYRFVWFCLFFFNSLSNKVRRCRGVLN